ncbi:diphthine methyltransferase [[Candida] railenensis]|uniref:methylated diphthine methylhydrolase n=1 Tax=[Candida] railenensis TaxID=45579 RepID=A0A9P0VXH8_9ASCO|nr:diphthine methyltransferase [[Candida] railenensis]
MSIETSRRISGIKTQLPPCCLQIHEDNTVLIGTYQLEKESGTRHGSVEVYKFDQENLAKVSTIHTAGAVLDIKINPHDSSNVVTAHSTGNLMVWKYENGSISEINDMHIFEPDTLVTSIFFSPLSANLLLATLTTGESAIINIETGTLTMLHTQHNLECWTGSFGEVGQLQNVVYTGGDDARAIAHDLRTNEMIWSTNTRHHTAGVVSILSPGPNWNSSNGSQIWTGSYDDHLRVFDLRVTDKVNPALMVGIFPRALKEENLGGGVWRLIPSKVDRDDRVLICCMYDGARIAQPDSENDFSVTRYFKGDHESMCYGGDWTNEGERVVTCSFYDNIVQTWSPDLIE